MARLPLDRKCTRLNSSHVKISYAVFCLKKKIIPVRAGRRSKIVAEVARYFGTVSILILVFVHSHQYYYAYFSVLPTIFILFMLKLIGSALVLEALLSP